MKAHIHNVRHWEIGKEENQNVLRLGAAQGWWKSEEIKSRRHFKGQRYAFSGDKYKPGRIK